MGSVRGTRENYLCGPCQGGTVSRYAAVSSLLKVLKAAVLGQALLEKTRNRSSASKLCKMCL